MLLRHSCAPVCIYIVQLCQAGWVSLVYMCKKMYEDVEMATETRCRYGALQSRQG